MKRHISSSIILSVATLIVMVAFSACSTKKNTAGSRFWQSFTTRFNVYFNGNEAYKAGCLEKEKGNKDDFTERLPFFMVGNEASRSLGQSNFETAITKCEKAIQLHSIKKRPQVSAGKRRSAKMKSYLRRQEFNPFLKNAWLLMGRAQFMKGDFLGAASTFAYITRHYAEEPDVVAEARIWLARCYAGQDWFYDAEDALQRVGRDSLSRSLRRERDATLADLLLRQGRTADATPYLERSARAERGHLLRARLFFLLGQVQQALGNTTAAYKAYGRCLRQSPPYEMALNARVAQTEVMATGAAAKKMMARLRRMAKSANNKDYLDQIYYALGNICLSQRDTTAAISAYERGRAGSTRGGVEKGVLLLRLGEVYWNCGRYDRAQSCYGEAVGLINKMHPDYETIVRRSKVLDALVPYTSAVQLQDSLLALSVMPENDRLAAIDRVIADLRRQEKEAQRAKADSIAEAARRNGDGGNMGTRPSQPKLPTGDNKAWYFYNPTQVNQGKQDFQRQWGRRKNEDNWRRSNRTVLAATGPDADQAHDYAAEDSIAAATAAADTARTDSVKSVAADDDPHERAFYLKQIPFTQEAKTAAHAIIQDGLYNAGLIEKDQLEDFPLAARTLNRLNDTYPQFEKAPDVLYQLFLLYSRWKRPGDAERYRRELARRFPDAEETRLITSPDYERNARYGIGIEDSLYTATYDAYRRRDNATVEANFARSSKEFPNGANRPKFIFVHALSRIGTAPVPDLIKELRNLVEKYPESDVSEMAGMMVKGLEAGRVPGAGPYDVGSLWARRTAAANAAVDAAGRARRLSAGRDVPFVVILAYPTDSLDDGRLLYDLAHFNFTGFLVRNFDITRQRDADITQLRVGGFRSFAEAHTYAQQLYADKYMHSRLKGVRLVLISVANLELLGTTYSFEDYARFYEKNYAPIKLNRELPLDMQDMPVEQHYEDEYTPDQLDKQNQGKGGQNDTNTDDGGEWYTPN